MTAFFFIKLSVCFLYTTGLTNLLCCWIIILKFVCVYIFLINICSYFFLVYDSLQIAFWPIIHAHSFRCFSLLVQLLRYWDR